MNRNEPAPIPIHSSFTDRCRTFSAHPKNRMFDDVLLKVALLNTLYNTRLLAIVAMADHIHALRVDAALEAVAGVFGRQTAHHGQHWGIPHSQPVNWPAYRPR